MLHQIKIEILDVVDRMFEIAITDLLGEQFFYTIIAGNEIEAVEIAKQAYLN